MQSDNNKTGCAADKLSTTKVRLRIEGSDAELLELAIEHWRTSRDSVLAGLKDFLCIPSISTLPEHRADVAKAAAFVAGELTSMGMNGVTIISGAEGEQPLVYAEWLNAPGKPTLLLYGHYDVQPVDPLEEWISAPFDPQVRENKLYARGASDDKGQVYIQLKVLEGFLRTGGKLPVNIKVLFEGEEESTGQHIERFVRQNAEKLKCSVALVLDTGVFAPGLPTITTGLRGIVCAEVTCRGPRSDLHSGQYGGVAPNPAEELARIIGQLKTRGGRIRIPGFYDGIVKPTKAELAAWKILPFDEARYLKQEIGAPALNGDRRFPVLHRIFARPTLEVNGITGGFSGDGFKTVIPAKASAKISMRIVPGMDPDRIAGAFKQFIEKLTPSCVTTEVTFLPLSPAMVVDTSNPFIAPAAVALTKTFGVETVYVREGASIPIAATLQAVLAVPVLITGITLPDCNEHAPNESIELGHFYSGIDAIGRYMSLLGQM